jgi:predicted amidohydrolase YtcJ
MMIVPGFIDTHNHGRGEVLLYNVLVGNPFDVEFVTIQSIIDKLRARAATTPPGTWVEGYFFDDTKLKDNRSAVRRGMATFESATDTWLHLGQVALCAAKMRKRTTNSRSNNRGSWIVVLDADGLAGTGKEGTGVISEDSGQNTVRLRLYKTAG